MTCSERSNGRNIFHPRAEIAEKILTIFKHECDPWGVHVERVEVKSLVVAR